MIKNLVLTFMLCWILVSCGKKGNPEFKENKKKANLQLILINKA
tara:strand:+ start:636 stop:767 length:132 start_codon:yes stop_codon:yes gene_type:complete